MKKIGNYFLARDGADMPEFDFGVRSGQLVSACIFAARAKPGGMEHL